MTISVNDGREFDAALTASRAHLGETGFEEAARTARALDREGFLAKVRELAGS